MAKGIDFYKDFYVLSLRAILKHLKIEMGVITNFSVEKQTRKSPKTPFHATYHRITLKGVKPEAEQFIITEFKKIFSLDLTSRWPSELKFRVNSDDLYKACKESADKDELMTSGLTDAAIEKVSAQVIDMAAKNLSARYKRSKKISKFTHLSLAAVQRMHNSLL